MAAPRAIALAFLLLVLLPPAQAQPPANGDWRMQIVAGQGGEDHDYISIAGTTGKIGVAFHRATSNDVGFALGDVEHGWTIQTLDIQSSDTTIVLPHLAKIDDATWVISAIAGGLVKVYKSTNAGATWTVKDTVGTSVSGLAMGSDGAHLAMSFVSSGPASAIRVSTDAGETWKTTLTGTSSSPGFVLVRGPAVTWYSSSGTSTSPQDVKSRSSDDDNYWTTSQEVVESSSKSASNLVAAAATGNFLALHCFTSCSVTPQYDLSYFYASGSDYVATTLDSNIDAAISGGSANPLASTPDGQVFILAQKTSGAAPLLYHAASRTAVPTALTTSLPDGDGTAAITAGNDRVYVALSNGTYSGRLEVWSAPLPQTAPVAVPSDTVAISGLNSFAMDERGFAGIVRYNVGADSYVRTLNGAQLTLSPTTENTFCSRSEGIMAFYSAEADGRTYVAYTDCYHSTGYDPDNVAEIRIRGADMGTPFRPDHCKRDDGGFEWYCVADISAGELASPDDDVRHLRSLHQFPIDYTQHAIDGELTGVVRMAWAFTTMDGKAGLVSYTHRQTGRFSLGDDKSQVTTEVIDVSGGPVDYSCTTTNLRNHEDYFYAGAQASDVKGFKVYYKPEDTNLGEGTLEVQLNGMGVGGSATRSPRGIGCGNNFVVIAKNDGEILAINVTSGHRQTILKDPVNVIANNAIAVDPTGQTAAWIRAGKIQLFDLRTWRFVDNLTAPTGSVTNLWLTYYSKDLYVGLYNVGVQRYETGVLFGSDNFTANPSADTDNDGVINSEDPDLDGDGICNAGGPLPKHTRGAENGCQPGPNGVDPDVDGDGLCNGPADLPSGTVGAIYGCRGGDSDDDDDAVPDDRDEAPAGAGPDAGGCVNCSGTGHTPTEHPFGLSDEAAFGWGLLIIVVLAGLGYAFAGPAPMVVGGLATLGMIADVAFRFWSPWTLVALGGATGVIGFSAALSKRVGGKT